LTNRHQEIFTFRLMTGIDLMSCISFEMRIKQPFDLSATMQSGQTNEAAWLREEGRFVDLEVLYGIPLKFSIEQRGSVYRPTLEIHLTSNLELPEVIFDSATRYLTSLFRLDDDIESFYNQFKSDPIGVTFQAFRGLRLMKATNPFESLICSICSQNTSVERLNSMMTFLRRRWGRRFTFNNNSEELFSFPEPYILAKAEKHKLIRGNLGYRADYIREAALRVASRRLNLKALGELSYPQVYSALLEMRGVGPKVADCFCLYGAGFTRAVPVDRWVARAVADLYFDGCDLKRNEVGEFIRGRFGEWAGYAQLYLFHYWRTSRG